MKRQDMDIGEEKQLLPGHYTAQGGALEQGCARKS